MSAVVSRPELRFFSDGLTEITCHCRLVYDVHETEEQKYCEEHASFKFSHRMYHLKILHDTRYLVTRVHARTVFSTYRTRASIHGSARTVSPQVLVGLTAASIPVVLVGCY